MGGDTGRSRIAAWGHILGGAADDWRIASAGENAEIVRCRLFEPSNASATRRWEAVVRAFSEPFGVNSSELPPERRKGDCPRRMQRPCRFNGSYSIGYSAIWSDLERFQPTRVPPRPMAKVIHSLWMNDDANLLLRAGASGHRRRGATPRLGWFLP